MRMNKGFTLIEIAIVLVIVGLLLGSVLKGQELINASRVRNIATTLDGIKIAYLGFQDRYRAFPGDVPDAVAATSIPNSPATGGGCGVAGGFCANGEIDPAENLVVWMQIARSGFIHDEGNRGLDVLAAPVHADRGFVEWRHREQVGDHLALFGTLSYWSDSEIIRAAQESGLDIPQV